MDLLKIALVLLSLILIKIGDLVLSFFNFFQQKILSKLFTVRSSVLIQSPGKKTVKIFRWPSFRFFSMEKKKKVYEGNSNKALPILEEEVFVNITPQRHSYEKPHCWQDVKNFLSRYFSLTTKKMKLPKRKKRVRKKTNTNVSTLSFSTKIKFFIFGIIFSSLFVFLPLVGVIFYTDLPDPYSLSFNSIQKTTKIYDRNDNLLYEIYANQNRTIVKLSDIPVNLKYATIAIEDKNFYDHFGFDVKGIVRAALNNYKNGETLQGGSTITQQLVKSSLLTPKISLQRKIKEVVLAFMMERAYSKEHVLELYFNFVPYGGTAWGVEAASEVYFGKNVKDLDLAQCAFLAGMPKAPSIYSPFNRGGNIWKQRQKEVLEAMVQQKFISRKQAQEAFEQELVFKDPRVPIKAPHFVMYVKDTLAQKYGLSEVERGGLQVKTTLDLNIQDQVQKIVEQEVENNVHLNIGNGAALVTSPSDGQILAMVGSHDYYDVENSGNVNVTTSLRQPGSTIKLITYTLALSQGFTEATMLDDSSLSIKLAEGYYTPVNYDGKFHGRLPLRYAFGNSLNIPAVRTAQKLGVSQIVEFGKLMGIKSWDSSNNYGLSITLGGAEVTMLDLATAFGTIANKGSQVDPDPILEVTSLEGKVIYEKKTEPKMMVDPGVAFIVSDILSDNDARAIEFGLNSPLKIEGHRVSVKTGTSDNKRDNWTIGFTPDYLVATWVGNNDNSPMSQSLTSGITGAAPMWNRIISELLKDKKDAPLTIPDNIIKKPCYGRYAYFIRGTENYVKCSDFSLFPISPTPTPGN